MTKLLYCNKCKKWVDADKFSNIDCYLYHCTDCMSVLLGESYEGDTLSPDEIIYFTTSREKPKHVPCQCGEGYLELTVKEIKDLIKETTKQIECLTVAAEELLDYKEMLETILETN